MAQYHKTPELSVSSVFKLRPEELELFFERDHQKHPDNEGERRECLIILEKVDWYDGLIKSLATDPETGIIGDVKDIKRRKKFFGKNKKSLPSVRTFWQILWDQFDERYIQILLVFATVSLVVSIFTKSENGANNKKWLEAISIYFAVLFAAMVQTFCDWGKEKQFLRLQNEIQNEKVTVLRGQYGTSQTVLSKDLVVGDIVLLNQGDRVPADCILVQEMDMHVDQQMFFPDTQHSDNTVKQCSYANIERDIQNNPDMVLLQDSIVMAGTGKALVLAVGEHTLKEKEISADLDRDKNALQIEKEVTVFQKKLEILSQIVGNYAYTITGISLVLFGIVWLLFVMCSDYKLVEGPSITRAIDLASTAIALLIVCIPEGMPLVISMAMAFSVDTLKGEHLLIKRLGALETAGQLNEIITGKTATLTTGDMTVERINMVDTTFAADQLSCNLEIQNMLWDCAILNSDAHMQMSGPEYKPRGSPVEVGILNLLLNSGVSVQEKLVERERDHILQLWIPFSSDRKRMTVAYSLKDHPDHVRLVTKGAPEKIVPLCSAKLDSFAQQAPFDGQSHEGQQYLVNVVENDLIMAANAEAQNEDGEEEPLSGLKAISIAYRDFSREEFEAMKIQYNNFEEEQSRQYIENNLCMIASLGLSDPLREEIIDSILSLSEGKTNVRIVSGDHKQSVMATAFKLSFVEQINDDSCIQASDDLEKELEPLMELAPDERNDGDEARGMTYKFRNQECRKRFKSLKKKVRLVYRATPNLKRMLVCAFRESGSTIGVTGEGLSDARSLSEASVGFTMGQDGCSAAKDHSDVILMNDNFETVITSIRYGRNIQDNVRKFIQFQMTVNVACIIFVVSTSLILGHSPFSVMQLLWINLIMDVLAAIAFATENPHPTEIRKERINAADNIITKPMMRSILSQSIYQLFVMFLMMYAGPFMFGIEYNLYTTELREELGGEEFPTSRLLHQTFLFQTFVMMNMFNMLNCRILDQMPVLSEGRDQQEIAEDSRANEIDQPADREFNIFLRPFSNFWYWIVFFGELNLQFFMVGYGGIFGAIFQTTPMSFGMHMTAVSFGIGSWILAAIMKTTGNKLLECMPEFGEGEEALEKSANVASGEAFRRKSVADDDAQDEDDSVYNSQQSQDKDYSPTAQ